MESRSTQRSRAAAGHPRGSTRTRRAIEEARTTPAESANFLARSTQATEAGAGGPVRRVQIERPGGQLRRDFRAPCFEPSVASQRWDTAKNQYALPQRDAGRVLHGGKKSQRRDSKEDRGRVPRLG